MGEGGIAVGPYLVEEGALAAIELFGSFPGQPMGRLLQKKKSRPSKSR